MGGKKKAKKAAGGDDEDTPEEQKKMLEAAVQSLQVKLVLEQERKDKSMTMEKQIQDNEVQLASDLKSQKTETKACVDEMTEQYKFMETRLQEKIDKDTKEVER